MNILITSAATPVALNLADTLSEEHIVRLTNSQPVDSTHEFVVSALGHDASTNLLVRGMDAIVHVADPAATADDLAQIDYYTRGTYNLLTAAAEEGVSRVVLLSTLELMAAYDPVYKVTERWRPLPSTDTALLGKHLCANVCREFAREHKTRVVVLRLGDVVFADAQEVEATPTAVDSRDVAHAVDLALTAALEPWWSVFHIQSDSDGGRFPVQNAKSGLGFSPLYQFELG